MSLLTACHFNNSESSDNEQSASHAELSGIPYSKATVNQKEEKTVLVVSASARRKFLDVDVVCLASPTYYMNVNDRMKIFIDATYLAFGDDKMSGKEFYYITACADTSEDTAEWCLNGFRGFVMCLPSPTERGSVCAYGMGRAGAVKGTKFEKEAYGLGKTINKK